VATSTSSSRSSAFTQSLGPNFHGVGGMSGDTPENIARAKANEKKPTAPITPTPQPSYGTTTKQAQDAYKTDHAKGAVNTNSIDPTQNPVGYVVQTAVDLGRRAAEIGNLTQSVGEWAADHNKPVDPKAKKVPFSLYDPKTKTFDAGRLGTDVLSVGGAVAGDAAVGALGNVGKKAVGKVASAVKNSFESPIVVNAAEKTPGVSTQFDGYFAPTKISNSTEQLISKEKLGKYLAKTKASKTQVTPVRKLGSDFKVEPSLTGPTTIKSKLGDTEGYPRGYNPKQMKQVTDAEAQGRMSIGSNSVMEEGRNHAAHEAALLRENVARSKYDPTNLRTTNAVTGKEAPLDVRIGFKRPDQSEAITAFYSPDERFIAISPENVGNNTTIHEIGHDAQLRDPKILDLLDDATKAGARYKDKLQQTETSTMLSHGVKEGDAERFADENWVPDPRGGTKQVTSSYKAANFISKKTGDKRTHLFGQGYRAAKGPEITAEHPEIKAQIEKAIVEAKSGLKPETIEKAYGMKWTNTDFLNAAGIPIPKSLIPPSRFSTLRDSITKQLDKGTGN